jgi:hypothetical protein
MNPADLGDLQGGVPPCSLSTQDRILELREQIALMDEPPLWPG